MRMLRSRIRRYFFMWRMVFRMWLYGLLSHGGIFRSRKPINMMSIKIIRVNGKKIVKSR